MKQLFTLSLFLALTLAACKPSGDVEAPAPAEEDAPQEVAITASETPAPEILETPAPTPDEPVATPADPAPGVPLLSAQERAEMQDEIGQLEVRIPEKRKQLKDLSFALERAHEDAAPDDEENGEFEELEDQIRTLHEELKRNEGRLDALRQKVR